MRSIKAASWWLIKRLIRLQFPQVQQLSTTELAMWLADNKRSQPLLLDARTLAEYQVSHLQNAQPIADNSQEPLDAVNYTTPIVVYCSVGYRSSAIAHQLQSSGYKRVFNLEGSIFQWANENRPVYRQSKAVAEVHPYNKFWQYLLNQN